MTQADIDALFVDTNVPGLNDPAISQQAKRSCLRILRQCHHLALNIADELAPSADPQVDQAVNSIREAALHAIDVALS